MKGLKGLYLVVDSRLGPEVLKAAEAAIRGGVDLVQLLDGPGAREIAMPLRQITRTYGRPLLVNNNLDLAEYVRSDGLHVDGHQPLPSAIKKALGNEAAAGYTCGNDLEKIRWAENAGADYVSFCSIFPSGSAGECEIVPLETVARGKRQTCLPVFASGGITQENVERVLATGVDGIAVISAILKTIDPEASAKRFKRSLEMTALSLPESSHSVSLKKYRGH